jgi:hypothetical protein
LSLLGKWHKSQFLFSVLSVSRTLRCRDAKFCNPVDMLPCVYIQTYAVDLNLLSPT